MVSYYSHFLRNLFIRLKPYFGHEFSLVSMVTTIIYAFSFAFNVHLSIVQKSGALRLLTYLISHPLNP